MPSVGRMTHKGIKKKVFLPSKSQKTQYKHVHN